jgi:hypothetical protein
MEAARFSEQFVTNYEKQRHISEKKQCSNTGLFCQTLIDILYLPQAVTFVFFASRSFMFYQPISVA